MNLEALYFTLLKKKATQSASHLADDINTLRRDSSSASPSLSPPSTALSSLVAACLSGMLTSPNRLRRLLSAEVGLAKSRVPAGQCEKGLLLERDGREKVQLSLWRWDSERGQTTKANVHGHLSFAWFSKIRGAMSLEDPEKGEERKNGSTGGLHFFSAIYIDTYCSHAEILLGYCSVKASPWERGGRD